MLLQRTLSALPKTIVLLMVLKETRKTNRRPLKRMTRRGMKKTTTTKKRP
jgi:hypothetical protein